MSDISEDFKATPAAQFADFGLTEGIHFRPRVEAVSTPAQAAKPDETVSAPATGSAETVSAAPIGSLISGKSPDAGISGDNAPSKGSLGGKTADIPVAPSGETKAPSIGSLVSGKSPDAAVSGDNTPSKGSLGGKTADIPVAPSGETKAPSIGSLDSGKIADTVSPGPGDADVKSPSAKIPHLASEPIPSIGSLLTGKTTDVVAPSSTGTTENPPSPQLPANAPAKTGDLKTGDTKHRDPKPSGPKISESGDSDTTVIGSVADLLTDNGSSATGSPVKGLPEIKPAATSLPSDGVTLKRIAHPSESAAGAPAPVASLVRKVEDVLTPAKAPSERSTLPEITIFGTSDNSHKGDKTRLAAASAAEILDGLAVGQGVGTLAEIVGQQPPAAKPVKPVATTGDPSPSLPGGHALPKAIAQASETLTELASNVTNNSRKSPSPDFTDPNLKGGPLETMILPRVKPVDPAKVEPGSIAPSVAPIHNPVNSRPFEIIKGTSFGDGFFGGLSQVVDSKGKPEVSADRVKSPKGFIPDSSPSDNNHLKPLVPFVSANQKAEDFLFNSTPSPAKEPKETGTLPHVTPTRSSAETQGAVPGPKESPAFLTLGELLKPEILKASTTPASPENASTNSPVFKPSIVGNALQLAIGNAESLLPGKKAGTQPEFAPAKKPATTGDGTNKIPLSNLTSRFGSKLEEVAAAASKPAVSASKPESVRHDSAERANAAGAIAPAPEASKAVQPPPAFKASSLNRDASGAVHDISSKVISIETFKAPDRKSLEVQNAYSTNALKTPIVGSSGRNSSVDSVTGLPVKSSDVTATPIKSIIPRPGSNASVTGLDSNGAAVAVGDVSPVGIKRVSLADVNAVKGVDTVDGVKLDSLSVGGLKSSIINFVSGKNVSVVDKTNAAAKVESVSSKIEIPAAGIGTAQFINGATLNTSHGIAGVVRVDASSIGKDFPVAIAAAKDFSGKVEGAVNGAKADAVSTVKDSGMSIIQVTTMAGKYTAIDLTPAAKADTNVVNGTIGTNGLVSINGSSVQPTAQSMKGDVVVPGKVDVAGRPIEGIKCPQPGDVSLGTVRGTAFTPSVANAIADAIRLGQPTSGRIVLPNGSYAITYGNEVLYFPGLRAALKFAEVVGLIDAESDQTEEQEQQKPSSTVRIRYSVKEGETLESIAETELGDVRLSDLVLTINRSEILYRLTDTGKIPFVYAGQLIWLPSEQELNIYRKNFFGKAGTKSGGVSGVSSAEDTIEDQARESGRAVRKALHDEFLANNAALQPGRPKTTVRDVPQLKLSFKNNITPPIIAEQGQQIDAYAQTVVRSASDKKFTDNSNNFSSVSEPLRVQDTHQSAPVANSSAVNRMQSSANVLPFKLGDEQAVFLHASVDGDDYSDTVIVRDEAAPVVEMERLLDVRLVSNSARVVVTDLAKKPTNFFVRLEVRIDGGWTVVASYDGDGDSTERVRYAKNGTKNSMKVQLPAHAVKRMAVEDFIRNWATYNTNYETNNIRRIQVDSVPPTPVSFKGVASIK